MLTTTIAGRTWSFSHAIGRLSFVDYGFAQPMDLAIAPGGVIYVLSRGRDTISDVVAEEGKRIGKVTMEEEFLGDFGQDRLGIL